MSYLSFADRYAEAGLSPTAATIEVRKAAADRIRKDITKSRILDLVSIHFGLDEVDLGWFRDEFASDDGSFSLINNERECAVLASAVLAELVTDGNAKAILAVIAGSVGGKRTPREANQLVAEAREAYIKHAISNRETGSVETKIKAFSSTKLAEEIQSLAAEPSALAAMIGKVRAEEQEGMKSLANQLSASLALTVTKLNLLREETQILWWLFGESSRTLNKPFNSLEAAQAAVLAGLELGDLTSVTTLGPVAAVAMLERVIQLGSGKIDETSIAAAIDGFEAADLNALGLPTVDLPARNYPLLAAINKAQDVGRTSWHGAFEKTTSLDSAAKLPLNDIAFQIYVEHLLGQLS